MTVLVRVAHAHAGAVLEAVSALGATSVQSLRNLLPESDVDAILEAAIAEQVLALDEDLSVRFAHPLLGSVVYTSLSPLARRSLHARLAAQATEPDVRARHLALSTDDPDESIASLLERAATRAAGRGANDLASEFAGHGRRLTLRTPTLACSCLPRGLLNRKRQ